MEVELVKTNEPHGFVFTEVETGRAAVFRQLHAATGGHHRAMNPARFTYELTPTGVGTKCVIRCACGIEKDITDYESW